MNNINLLYNNVYFARNVQCVLLYAKPKLIYLLPKTPTKKPQPPFSDRPAKNPPKIFCERSEQNHRQKSINAKNFSLPKIH